MWPGGPCARPGHACGALAPPAGILIYEGLEMLHQGAGRLALLVPLAMTTAGAVGFNRMRRALGG